MKRLVSLLAVFALLLGVAGCGAKTAKPAAAAWSITIEGVKDSAYQMTADEFAKIKTVEIEAMMKKKDGTEQKQKFAGYPLAQAIEALGVKDYTTILVEAKDGYSKEYTPDLVSSQGTVLAVKVDGKDLDAESAPLYLVVDGKGSNWWIKAVKKIKVVK